jgi:hypothetical protein
MISTKRPRLTISTMQLSSWHTIHPQQSTRHSRAAKDQAIMKLDAQAKDLADFNGQAALLNHESTTFRRTLLASQPTGHSSRPLETRISARESEREDLL